MKNKILIVAILVSGLFIACQEDFVAPTSFSDAGWYTSEFRDDQSNYQVGINKYISFSDLSQNAVSHKWMIPEGSYFLEGPITRKDSTYDQFIIKEGELETEDKTIHVLFKKSGVHNVTIRNIFKDSVTYRGLDTLHAVKQDDGMWLMEHNFVVDVFDTIQAKAVIKQAGVEVPQSEDTIYVEAGDELQFIDMTTVGRPNARTWRVAGESSSDSVANILFKKLGVFFVTLSSNREGENIPNDGDFLRIPNPIKVIPSSKPFVLSGDIVELESEIIQVPFNGEFSPFVGKNDFFTIMVNDVEFDIESINLNSSDATILEIKLVEPIYRPDVITVSLADGSGIQSTDTRSPQPFTNEPVMMHDVNLWNDAVYGFESDGWIETDGGGSIARSTEQVASGSFSLKYTNAAGENWTRGSGENFKVELEAGKTYTITWKMWIDPSTNVGSFGPWFYWNDGASGQQFWQNMNDKPRSEWINFTRDHEVTEAGPAYFTLRTKGDALFYLDDVRIVETEIRP